MRRAEYRSQVRVMRMPVQLVESSYTGILDDV